MFCADDVSEEEKLAKTLVYNVKGDNYMVDDFWLNLRSICIGTPVSRIRDKSEDTVVTQRPDIFRSVTYISLLLTVLLVY